jgi:hypothetical protein
MADRLLIVDALKYSNWSEKIFGQMHQSGLPNATGSNLKHGIVRGGRSLGQSRPESQSPDMPAKSQKRILFPTV